MKVSTYPDVIIGYAGEQNAREVKFDIESELNLWPNSVPTLFYRRPGEEEIYPAVTSLSDNFLVWVPDAFAMEIPGKDGAVQIVFTTPGTNVVVGKTRLLRLIVEQSFVGGEPAAADNWITSLTGLAADVTNALDGARGTVDEMITVQHAAETAQGLAESARDEAITAKDAAEDARDAAVVAKNGAIVAKNAVEANVALSESWAKGDTGIRFGENINNAKYYSEIANSFSNIALEQGTNIIAKVQEAALAADRANSKADIAYSKSEEAKLYAYQANQAVNRALSSESNVVSSANIAAQKASIATTAATAAVDALNTIEENYGEFVEYISDIDSYKGTYILPQNFDAQGDGETDDTEALSQAMNQSNAIIEGSNFVYKLGELVLTGCQNLVIQNFRFYHGISITLKSCENITFRNCVWDEFQDNGIEGKNVQCVILTTTHTGSEEWISANNWRMSEVCKNITFDNCQFISTHYTENTPSLFQGTKPHYNTGMCLRLEGVDGLRVIGCYFTQNRGNACIQQNCYAPLGDFEIVNNFFYLNCWGGIELYRYTGMSSHPTRVIQGNRFIGHGLGYLPWSYLETFPENERGVGTAVLLGGNVSRIQNEPAYCAVYNNYFEDNNESSVEGWQWNPVKNNVILGNGVLQDADSVTEMTAKYKISYTLYPRKNPSQNPIYMGQYADVVRYSSGEVRSIENNTIGRTYGTKNPIIFRGYFYEPIIIRNNTMTDDALYTNENAKYAHFLNVFFDNGLIWENNIGMKPYFNECNFNGGEYKLDELLDVYNCTFTSQAFDSLSKLDRFQQIRSARFSPEYASLRDNDVSTLVDGKPVLGAAKHSVTVVIPEAIWDIKDEEDYADGGYVFDGSTSSKILDTGLSLGATDTNWTIFVDTTTNGDNSAGNNTYLIKLLTFSDSSGNLSLEFGSRYTDQAWTWLFPNGVWNYDTAYQIDGSSAKNLLRPERTSRIALRHKAGSGKIEVFALRNGDTASSFDYISLASISFTSGTAGTLRFGGVPNSNRPLSYYNGTIADARVFESALTDAQISVLVVGSDITSHEPPEPVYDITEVTGYTSGVGFVMDGSYALNTGIALLENTNDFTIITKFKFDNMAANGAKPNFTFYPVFSAMSADPPSDAHTGNTDKGFDVGLSMQNGKDMNATARGGFIAFRRDWRYVNMISIDDYNYSDYYNKFYTIVVQRKDNVITLYDNNLSVLGTLTGDYATSIVNGNLTIGAQMGYGTGYSSFFKGTIAEFQVYDCALDLADIEERYPSIADNAVSKKGAVTYHLSNKNNSRKSVRYALVEVNYDLGEYNSAEYTVQYPIAFGIRMDQIYDDVYWVPCSSSKRVVLHKLCKWSAVYDPFESWDLEIINPGIVPNLNVKIEGVKVLLLSKQEAVPVTIDATDFNVAWDGDLSDISINGTVSGYVQYTPLEADSGLTLTASSDDTSIATVSISGQDVIVTGVSAGETLIRISIPYGVERAYDVSVSS